LLLRVDEGARGGRKREDDAEDRVTNWSRHGVPPSQRTIQVLIGNPTPSRTMTAAGLC
jgi:hypothetical protein